MMPIMFLLLWIIILILLKKLNMHFFKFIIGSVGLFCFLMFFFRAWSEVYLEYGLTYVVSLIGKLTGILVAFPENSMITIYYKVNAISFFIDYECSGFIESCVYVSVLIFYPIYKFTEKVKYFFGGVVFILICNIIRIIFICILSKILGGNLFFFIHTVFARILFFTLMVILYYYVFTMPHILRQKVGDFKYDK
ncbi:exosortase family protein XrtG [uncultured Clostridium sp.]|uniref:exosortase family protein XrtG n=1 Tax=uncultured Clostridium sp. TaxID=59620 RepID=UPI0028EB0189|nr:exosortase family protein XrtG [uncultured Clostridium sp.]